MRDSHYCLETWSGDKGSQSDILMQYGDILMQFGTKTPKSTLAVNTAFFKLNTNDEIAFCCILHLKRNIP